MTLENLKKNLNNCTKCDLFRTRNNIVFSDGSRNAKIMLIGEAPGADEDKIGIPFVGRAGKLLNEFLVQAGLNRKEHLYIANTVKCRPPENRKPLPAEKIACAGNLKAQIDIVKPKVIVLCGTTAMESFIKEKKLTITKARGRVFEYENGIKLVPIFHPSYLLRQHSTEPNSPRELMLKDLKMIKKMAQL
ncbi:MAG: uracil-DNA glycosylase [Candidatus Gastranaerophilales bacterium]|nr:uracil-DNA glycosylase [Candidatus Gastranaerophilales bacterium]